ncbi:MAG: hypothetical protein NBV77_06805 [Bacteroidia bacterium]|nr:hypothetical protein [Bacteroidia bacterium]
MRVIKSFFLLILCTGFGNLLLAQKTYFKTYFSGSNIYDVIELDSSFWAATESKIVNVNKLTKEASYYSLPDKHPIFDYSGFKFLKDASGKLWVGGNYGLYYWDNSQWIKYLNLKHSKFQSPIKMLCSDPKSGIWFVDKNYVNEIIHIDGNVLTTFPVGNALLIEFASFDLNNDLWLNTTDDGFSKGGIYRLKDSMTLEPRFGDTSWKVAVVLSTYFDKDKTVYMSGIARKDGSSSDFLVKYVNGQWIEIYKPVDGVSPSKLRDISIDSKGNKFLITGRHVLNFTSDTLKYYIRLRTDATCLRLFSEGRVLVGTQQPAFPALGVGDGAFLFKDRILIDSFKLGTGKFNSNEIYCLNLDADSNLWVGSYFDHLSVKKKNGWIEYYNTDPAVPLMPEVILRKKDTMIAVGEFGIHYWFNNEWHYQYMDLYGNKSATIGSNGNVYLSASHRNVCEMNLYDQKCFPNLKFPGINILDKPLCTDKFGRVWVGAGNYLYHTNDTGGWTQVNTSGWGWPELGDKAIMKFDSKNHLWITTSHKQIYEFTGKYMVKHSPNYNNKIYPYYRGNAMAPDLNGNMFIGTYWDGLFRYDGKNWFVYDTSNSGLLSNDINAIALKNNGFWLGTALGVVDFTQFGPGTMVSNLKDTVAEITTFAESLQIKLYPNPSKGKINIESQYYKKLYFETFNIDGRLIEEGYFTKSTSFNIQTPGFYVCRIFDPETNLSTIKKFTIEP